MAQLSARDQALDKKAQNIITEAKGEWEAANKEYQATGSQAAKDRMTAANNKANQARSDYGGYTAGTSGTAYIKNKPASTGSGGGGGQSNSSKLNIADKAYLSNDQQSQILALKEQYAAAKASGAAQQELDDINAMANKIRSSAGYTLGTTGNDYSRLAYGYGGKSAAEIEKDLQDFQNKYWNQTRGWTNGYSVPMNTRSKANMIRQQMDANEKAMTDENRSALHNENLALAELLYKYTGQSSKGTYYNDTTGRWETWNPNVGYGYNVNGTQENIRNDWKKFYGYTDEEIEKWANDTSRYYNFVDQLVAARNQVDERSGYTGQYAQFVNGPYAQLAWGTSGWQNNNVPWEDTIGDGFNDQEDYDAMRTPQYDENGNIITTAPALKNNNNMSAYSAQFAPTAVNGVLAGQGAATPFSKSSDPNNLSGQYDYYVNYGRNASSGGGSSGLSGGSYGSYINQMYDSALQAQLASLESSYKQNISELDANIDKAKDTYTEQKRQTTGTNAREAANWRELANAYGMNTGTVGQAALAQSNQLQSNLNALEQAESAALTEIERQKALLGQQYQLQINEALAENNFQKAQALYQEAVRAEEALTQKQQYASQLALQYAQLAQSQSQYNSDLAYKYAAAGLSLFGSGDPGDYIPVPDPGSPGDGGLGDGTPSIDEVDQMSPTARSYLTSLSTMRGTLSSSRIGSNGLYPLEETVLKLVENKTVSPDEGFFMLRNLGYDPTKYFE